MRISCQSVTCRQKLVLSNKIWNLIGSIFCQWYLKVMNISIFNKWAISKIEKRIQMTAQNARRLKFMIFCFWHFLVTGLYSCCYGQIEHFFLIFLLFQNWRIDTCQKFWFKTFSKIFQQWVMANNWFPFMILHDFSSASIL